MPSDFNLSDIPIFSGLSPQQFDWLHSLMQELSYRAGEDIFVQGAAAQEMVILLEGQAVLFTTEPDGSQTPIAQLNAGQHINEEALLGEAIQSATLRAAQPTIALKLSRRSFQHALSQNPKLSTALGMAEGRAPLISPRFAEQREDEEILIQTHRHWWSFVRSAWLPLLLIPAMWFGAILLEAQALSLGLLGLSVMLPGVALFYFYLEWRNDSVIVTDQRVIRINRTILTLYRQVTQVGLESVHEVNFDLPAYDPFARLFRYGKVVVRTAGAQGNLELDFMPQPEQFQTLIMENRQYFEKRQAQRHHKLVREELQRPMDAKTLDDEASTAAVSDGPPRPVRGTNGYLSSRVEMTNGDIVYRKHASVWAQHTSVPILIILAAVSGLLLTFTLVGGELRIVTFGVSMVALLLGSLVYYWMDWDWRNDLYIISDDTITLVHKRPFFLQNLRDQILVERIDNVESISSGLFAALLRYGDVRMSLVGADEPKLFRRVARPQEIQQEISRRQHNKAQRRARYDAMQQREILSEYLGASPGSQPQPASFTAGVTGAAGQRPDSAASGQQEVDAGAVRAVRNPDRNRPPRTPCKALVSRQPQPDPRPRLEEAPERRPQRFRRPPADN